MHATWKEKWDLKKSKWESWVKRILSSLKSWNAGNPNAFYNDSTLFFLYNDLAFGFSGTLIQIFWFSYFLRRSQLAEIISSQQMNINLDWGEQNHFKLGVINPQNNKSGPCIRGILTLPYLPYFISIIYGLWGHQNIKLAKQFEKYVQSQIKDQDIKFKLRALYFPPLLIMN